FSSPRNTRNTRKDRKRGGFSFVCFEYFVVLFRCGRKNHQSAKPSRETAREAARPAAAGRGGGVSHRGLPRDPSRARETRRAERALLRARLVSRRKRTGLDRAGRGGRRATVRAVEGCLCQGGVSRTP